jgi:P-type Cu+ transporter
MTTVSATLPVSPATSTVVCRHCGDRCGAQTREHGGHAFCCAGCESVYRLLDGHGLTAYYAGGVGLSQRDVGQRDPGRFAAFDDPLVTARLVHVVGDVARVTLQTPALHCASCLWLLEQLWKVEPGVRRVDASLFRRTVTVEYLPTETTLRRIAEQLAALGYEPVIDAEPIADRVPAVRRRLYLQLGVAGFAFGNMMLFSIPRYVNGGPLEPEFQRLFDMLNVAFALPVLLYAAADYFRAAARSIRARAITLDVPIAIGLAALFSRSLFEIISRTGEGFLDSFAGLVFFLLIGKLFQQKAFDHVSFDRTARSFLPLSIRRVTTDGTSLVPIESLAPGDVILVRAHEIVPADAVLTSESGHIDYAFVTGEQDPVSVTHGTVIQAGGRVVGGSLTMTVARATAHSHLARLWTDPVFSTPKLHWLDAILARFGRAFTVSALVLAALGAFAWWPDARMSVTVATAVLIIACPCAFTLAAPLTLGTAMGALGRAGVYVRNPAVILDLSRVTSAVFDKTGTLTTGARVAQEHVNTLTPVQRDLVRRLATQSIHPISRVLAGDDVDGTGVTDVREFTGEGLEGRVDGRRVALGNASFIARLSGRLIGVDDAAVWAWVDGDAPVPIRLASIERPGVSATVRTLASRMSTWLISGDHPREADRWAALFGDRMRFRLSPLDKLSAVRGLQEQGNRVLMVGDGLNDAGALAAADVGIAVSDDTACLVPTCDAVLAGARLAELDHIVGYARRARWVISLCFTVSLAYNAVGLGLALTGRLTPLATAILMPVSSLTIVALSVGLMRRLPLSEVTR